MSEDQLDFIGMQIASSISAIAEALDIVANKLEAGGNISDAVATLWEMTRVARQAAKDISR